MARAVLVPVLPTYLDPDRVTHCAVPYGRALAARRGVPLVLGSVVEIGDSLRAYLEQEGESPEALLQRWVAERTQALQRLAKAIDDVTVEVQVRVGDPARQIAAMANELPALAVVMTSHMRAGLARLLIGSVTLDVLRHVQYPVLAVRARTPIPAPNASVTLTPVLVPLDGSPVAEEGIDAALAVFGTEGLTLHLVHVREGDGEPPAGEEYLAGLAKELGPRGVTATWSVRTGDVVEAIVQAADETGAGTIAMTTHGHGGLRETLFGSIAERVFSHARVPLLLARPTGERRSEPAQPAAAPERSEREALTTRSTVRVRDVMTSPVITVSPEDTLEHVARTMLERGVSAVPVVEEDGRLVGIVCEEDFFAREHPIPFTAFRAPQLFGHWVPPEGLEEIYELGRTVKAKEIMRPPEVTVTEDTTVSEAARLMLETGREHLPVVRDGKVVGIVTRRDLLKLMARPPSSQP